MRQETLPSWLLGLGLGAALAFLVAVLGVVGLASTVVATVVAFLVLRNLAVLSGVLTGLGGTWILLILRSAIDCWWFDQAPNQGCEAPGVLGPAGFGVVVLAAGALLGLAARWRLRHAGSGVA